MVHKVIQMRSIILLLAILALLSLLVTEEQSQSQYTSLAFTHVSVIDATGARIKPDMTVLITGDRIIELGPSGKVRVPKDAQVVNATGKFLIPGLWDMHVHWYGYDKAYLQLFIANGITGVRVMWGAPIHFEWRREIDDGKLSGPRMIISSTILDGPKPVWPGSSGIGNEAEARQAILKAKQEGADFVKVYSLLPRNAYFAIANETKKQALPFAGHVPFSVSVSEASDAGQKSIEHLTGILAECSAREKELSRSFVDAYSNPPPGQRLPDPALTRPLNRMMVETFSPEKAVKLFARLRRNDTWQCPTLTITRSGAFINDPDFRNDPRLKYMPRQLRTAWNPSTDFRFRGRSAQDFEISKLVYRKSIEVVGLMHQSGVKFLAGTDVGNPYCFPGFSLHDELELLVEAGLTPIAALQAATINPARFLSKEKDLGTVEKDKIADLVLLEENPLEDIRNTRTINAVVVGGKLIPKAELARMLAAVEAMASKE